MADARYLTAIDGAYSLAAKSLPASLAGAYSADAAEYNFTDYGGRFYWLKDDYGIGISLGLYSAFNARALLAIALVTGFNPFQKPGDAPASRP